MVRAACAASFHPRRAHGAEQFERILPGRAQAILTGLAAFDAVGVPLVDGVLLGDTQVIERTATCIRRREQAGERFGDTNASCHAVRGCDLQGCDLSTFGDLGVAVPMARGGRGMPKLGWYASRS